MGFFFKTSSVEVYTMDSGIRANSECKEVLKDLEKVKYDYVIIKITPKVDKKTKQELHVLETVPAGECATTNPDHDESKHGPVVWHCFSERIKKESCAFGAAYCHYSKGDGVSNKKLSIRRRKMLSRKCLRPHPSTWKRLMMTKLAT